MSTSIPARIARIDDKVGSVKKGLYGRSLRTGGTSRSRMQLDARKPEDVQLVLVAESPSTGSEKLMAAFAVKWKKWSVCGRKVSQRGRLSRRAVS